MRISRARGTVLLTAAFAAALSAPTASLLAVSPKVDTGIEARQALLRLAVFDGVWNGPVESIDPQGKVSKLTMTVRMGPMLDVTIRVLEERTISADGEFAYHLMGVFSFDAQTQECTLQAYSRGRVRSAVVHLTAYGFYLEMRGEAGEPMRLTTNLKKGDWQEIVETLPSGQPPITVRRIQLKHVGNSDWPGGGFSP